MSSPIPRAMRISTTRPASGANGATGSRLRRRPAPRRQVAARPAESHRYIPRVRRPVEETARCAPVTYWLEEYVRCRSPGLRASCPRWLREPPRAGSGLQEYVAESSALRTRLHRAAVRAQRAMHVHQRRCPALLFPKPGSELRYWRVCASMPVLGRRRPHLTQDMCEMETETTVPLSANPTANARARRPGRRPSSGRRRRPRRR